MTGELRGDASPRIIVTGGAGFVMSNVAHALLASNPAAQVLIVDIYEGDTLAEQFLAAFGSRVAFGFADVRDPRQLRDLGQDFDPTHVVHGAAVTHQPRLEVEQPSIYAEVNIMGTVNLLDWARGLPRLERFVHVSTGGVYGAPSPSSPLGSQPEDGPFDPPELYAVSKFAGELFVRRYRELFALGTVRVRLADVFGPMERATGARSGMSLPYKMMRAALERRPLRVTARSHLAPIDLTSAEDVASALNRLLLAGDLSHDVYNIAAGRHVAVGALFDAFRRVEPAFTVETVALPQAEVDLDPSNRTARYNAYDTARIGALGWKPRPLEQQLGAYRDWVSADPDSRCPVSAGKSGN